MMEEDLEFTDEEIQEELSKLGYYDIAPSRLLQFKNDLEKLVHYDKSKNSSQCNSDSSQSFLSGTDAPQIKTHLQKERVPLEETTSHPVLPSSSTHPIIINGKENHYGVEEEERFIINQSSRDRAHGLRVDGGSERQRYNVHVPQMNDSVSESESERRFIRRKTLRSRQDGSKVIDESVTESDVGSLGDLEDRLKEVRLADHMLEPRIRRPCSRPDSAVSVEAPYRLDPDDPRPPSVILRKADHPHTRNLKKCDPVNRFQQFRQSWSNYQVPGEKNHKRLRWNVREQMLYQDTLEYKAAEELCAKYLCGSNREEEISITLAGQDGHGPRKSSRSRSGGGLLRNLFTSLLDPLY